MKKGPYYTEDILVEKMQNGEYGWLDYVNHFLTLTKCVPIK